MTMSLVSHSTNWRGVLAASSLAVTLAVPAIASAQPSQRERQLIEVSPRELRPSAERQRAEDTRRELLDVMRQYPPALGRVLKLDPSLMANAAYLSPYPALAAFLQSHPEIAHDPGYFLEFVSFEAPASPADPTQRQFERAIQLWQNALTGLMVLTVIFTLVFTLTWLIRYFITHRRWLRAVQVQSELHGRVMERLGSSEELLAYVQSPAGRQLLNPPPAVDVPATPNLAAPFGRILWSIQTALVLGCGGVGLLIIKRYVLEEVAQMLLVLGVLAVALGVGFGLAAFASYMLSASLGLIDANRNADRPGA